MPFIDAIMDCKNYFDSKGKPGFQKRIEINQMFRLTVWLRHLSFLTDDNEVNRGNG